MVFEIGWLWRKRVFVEAKVLVIFCERWVVWEIYDNLIREMCVGVFKFNNLIC